MTTTKVTANPWLFFLGIPAGHTLNIFFTPELFWVSPQFGSAIIYLFEVLYLVASVIGCYVLLKKEKYNPASLLAGISLYFAFILLFDLVAMLFS